MARHKRPKPASVLDFDEDLDRHRKADDHLRAGVQYECALRCLWLLELRGTSNTLAISVGEDCRLTLSDGQQIYRQVKKRIRSSWSLSDPRFREFLGRACARYKADPSVRHEFHTNSFVTNALARAHNGSHILNAEDPRVVELCPDDTPAFSSSIRFCEEQRAVDPGSLLRDIGAAVEDLIEAEFSSPLVLAVVGRREVADLGARLVAAEFGLLKSGVDVGWTEVDRQIALEPLLQSIRARAGGRHFIDWRTACGSAETELDAAMANAMTLLQGNRLAPRELITEPDFLATLSEKIASLRTPGSAPSLLVIRGARGAGLSSTLALIGRYIEQQWPDVPVGIARGVPADTPGLIAGLSGPQGFVGLIDDLDDVWLARMRKPLVFLPSQTLLIATTHCDELSPEIQTLRRNLKSRLTEFTIPDRLTRREVVAITTLLRGGVGPSESEMQRIHHTNVRHAIGVLVETEEGPHLQDFRAVFRENHESLAPVLVASRFGVEVPESLLTSYAGKTLDLPIRSWVLRRSIAGAEVYIFEDAAEAGAMLTELYGARQPYIERSVIERLLALCDPADYCHRRFARHIIKGLQRRENEVARGIFNEAVGRLGEIIDKESQEIVVFSWLPICGHAGATSLVRRILARLPKRPDTVADFALWIEAGSVREAHDLFALRLREIELTDPYIAIRYARLVRLLPEADRWFLARQFCGLFWRASAPFQQETLSQSNALELFVRLVSDYGSHVARRRAMRSVAAVLDRRVTSDGIMPQNWIEACDRLFERSVYQERHHLALKIQRAILEGNWGPRQFAPKYRALAAAERRSKFEDVAKAASSTFRAISMAGDAGRLRPRLPSNVLTLAAQWTAQDEWQYVWVDYDLALRSLVEAGVPLERVSPLVRPGFRACVRCSAEEQLDYLKLVVPWLVHRNRPATEESGSILINLLSCASTIPVLPEEVRTACASALCRLAWDDDAVATALAHICDALELPRVEDSEPLPLPSNWGDTAGIVNSYLSRLGELPGTGTSALEAGFWNAGAIWIQSRRSCLSPWTTADCMRRRKRRRSGWSRCRHCIRTPSRCRRSSRRMLVIRSGPTSY
jgi:hypothetical protein